MHYQFLDFQFNSDSLTLNQQGKPVAIRHNEAKLLAYLLLNHDKVISKDEILAHVWRDKVVSEQAVFQNISHLRALFGNSAIKTFSKRGYQWQLPLTDEALSTSQRSGQPSPPANNTTRWKYLALVSMFIALFGFIGYSVTQPDIQQPTNQPAVQQTKLAYIPFIDVDQTTPINLSDTEQLSFTSLTDIDRQTFITSAELEYPKLKERYPLVLTGELRHHQGLFYLDFMLKGPANEWHGQLSHSSQTQLLNQLIAHISLAQVKAFVNTPMAPQLQQANLSLAHNQSPNDLIVLGQLISTYITMSEYDRAMVLADKLAQLATEQAKPQNLGQAYLYQSEILTRKELFDLSETKLALAINQFEQVNDLKHQADAWHANSWLAHQARDYNEIKHSLLKAAELSLAANDIARELDAITYLSVLAHKHRQEQDKYFYLTLAENKMTAYQLPDYHFAKVPFHYAIFTKKRADKEPHLKEVLAVTELTPNHWVAQDSRETLLKLYIAQDRIEEAEALLANLSSNIVENAFLHTLLARAKKQPKQVISHAQHTFELAQLAGNKTLSLNSALILCQLENESINNDFYRQYISDNKNHYQWQKLNHEALKALNLL